MNFKINIKWLPFLILLGFLYFSYNRLFRHIKDLHKAPFMVEQNQNMVDFDIKPAHRKYKSSFNAKPTKRSIRASKPIEPLKFKTTKSNVDLEPTHLFKELEKKYFYTPEERLYFFTQLGIDYLNGIVFDYIPALEIDPKTSEKYTSDIDGNNALTSKYKDDIANKSLMLVSIRWINPHIGHGIFAEEDLLKDGFIGIYGGVVQERILVKERDYAWNYPIKTLDGAKITLDGAKKGNELSFINDGISPNCVMKNIIGPDGLWYVCYIAAKDIKKGEQLLISYGSSYWDTRKYSYQELSDC